MILRPYQLESVAAIYSHLRTRQDNPCVVIPTGGGKTPVIAQVCKDTVERWKGRAVVLAHVKELLEQSAEKIRIMAPDLPMGVYSAGLNSRDLGYPVTVAGIQSIYNKAGQLGAVDLAIVDEAHLIPPDGDGRYRAFLGEAKRINPNLRVIGFTATPYRTAGGLICKEENILNYVCHEVGIKELIVQGYLCKLRGKVGSELPDFKGLHVRGGEFLADEVEHLMDEAALVDAACREIKTYTQNRKSVLIFASGVAHGQHIQAVMQRGEDDCGFICGETPSDERAGQIDAFRAGRLKYLANVNVLALGFDASNVDCVALVRPTKSPGLYYQMCGRGFRICPDKKDCLILDFGGNIMRHGPVDAVNPKDEKNGKGAAPIKECPECHEIIAAGFEQCPECGYQFPAKQRTKHDPKASDKAVLTGVRTTHVVSNVFYQFHKKKGSPPGSRETMRVDYEISWQKYVSEWICFEHEGYALAKAHAWWKDRSYYPTPKTVHDAVTGARNEWLAVPIEITVESGDPFDRIVSYRLGPKPGKDEMEERMAIASDDETPIPVNRGEFVHQLAEGDEIPF